MIETSPPALPTQEDYRRYDRIWKRVTPSLEPYPAVRTAQPPAAETADAPCRMVGGQAEAAELEGMIRDAIESAQIYRSLAPLAPTAEGRRLMLRLASEEAEQVRTLQSAYFLLTGGTYAVTVVLPPQPKLLWRDRLRERWQAAACGGRRFERAAEGMADACLRRLFSTLSADAYRRAERLQSLLAREL